MMQFGVCGVLHYLSATPTKELPPQFVEQTEAGEEFARMLSDSGPNEERVLVH